MSINQWNKDDRPREKLLAKGAGALSNAELLAILIGSGTTDESAVELMRRILKDCGDSLRALGRMDISELCKYKGIGEAKAITIMAACELGIRREADTALNRKKIDTSEAIYNYFHATSLQDLPYEECHVMLLDQHLNLIGTRLVSRGGISSSVVDVRLVLREAILVRATAIALCHNHPSGNCKPSAHDDALTKQLDDSARTMGIRLVDHIVLCTGKYYSYSDDGRL